MAFETAREVLSGIDASAHHALALHLATHGYWTQYCLVYAARACLRHTDLVEEFLRLHGYSGDVVVFLDLEVAPYGKVACLADMSRRSRLEEIEFTIAEHLVTAHPKPLPG